MATYKSCSPDIKKTCLFVTGPNKRDIIIRIFILCTENCDATMTNPTNFALYYNDNIYQNIFLYHIVLPLFLPHREYKLVATVKSLNDTEPFCNDNYCRPVTISLFMKLVDKVSYHSRVKK